MNIVTSKDGTTFRLGRLHPVDSEIGSCSQLDMILANCLLAGWSLGQQPGWLSVWVHKS